MSQSALNAECMDYLCIRVFENLLTICHTVHCMQNVSTISVSQFFASLEGDVYTHKESLIEILNFLLFLERAPEYKETLRSHRVFQCHS